MDPIGPSLVLEGGEPAPVVEPGAAKGVLGGVEPEGPDEVERATRGHAGPSYVASVVGDFGLDEHDVEDGVHRGGVFPRNTC